MNRRHYYIIVYTVFVLIFFEVSSRIFLKYTQIWVEDGSTWRCDWISKTNIDKGEKLTYHYYDVYDPTKGWYTKPNIRNIII